MNDKFAAILQEEFVLNRDPHHGTRLAGMTETQKRQSKRTCTLATIQTRCLSNTNITGTTVAPTRSTNFSISEFKLGVV